MALDQRHHSIPQISVLMTVFNCENYVVEAIESILKQSFHNFEFIIVDDGSTDGSVVLIQTCNDERIRFFQCEHRGRAAALNYAVGKALSPYIAFMDADDISLQERLEKQYHVLQRNPDIGIVSSWYQLIDKNGNQLSVVKKLPEHHAHIEYEMTIHCSLCFCCCMIRRDLIQQAGVFNEQLQSAIDYDLLLRLAPLTEFYNLQEILLYYRIHSSTLTSIRNKEQISNTFHIAKQYLNTLLERASSIQETSRLYFRLGVNEYYRGTMRDARQYFLSALPVYWMQWSLWRYLLPTFLGDKIFKFYRQQINRVYIS
jgi:glycosyltransferase involved in cell wall biosynthesis